MKISIVVIGLFYASSTASVLAAEDCRTAALPDGTPGLFCKDKKGNWQQQKGKVETTAAPVTANSAQQFYGDASYRGPAVFSYPIQKRQRRNRSLIDLAIDAAAPQARKEEILVTVTMRIEGAAVSGTITGGAWTTPVPITGTRRGGICDITASLNGDSVVYVGKCDASGFAGTVTSYTRRGDSFKGTFQLSAITFTDTSTRDTARADLKAKCDAGSASACVELDQMK